MKSRWKWMNRETTILTQLFCSQNYHVLPRHVHSIFLLAIKKIVKIAVHSVQHLVQSFQPLCLPFKIIGAIT